MSKYFSLCYFLKTNMMAAKMLQMIPDFWVEQCFNLTIVTIPSLLEEDSSCFSHAPTLY